MDRHQLVSLLHEFTTCTCILKRPRINYYSPQIFKSVGLTSSSAGLFATGIYGVVKVVFTALGLMFGVEQAGRKVSQESFVPVAIIQIMESSADLMFLSVVSHLRRCRPSFCHVLYWHQPSSAPQRLDPVRKQHIRHHLRVSICSVLLIWLGPHPLRPLVRVLP